MPDLFNGVQFKYTFRDYQAAFLENIREYISDDKIHVVAAPGAGKTILALEMCRMIGEKTLVIVPSIAIKEQWIERLTKDFTGTSAAGFVTSDLESADENTAVTVITYQMLHSMVRRGENVAAIIRKKGIRTIVLDECHHMRRVWFNSLKEVVSELKKCRLISLTATPPYDNGPEFRNYMDLCGEIDERITIGQLVKSNCLCPHQDYIIFNLPSREQRELMESIKSFSDDLMDEVLHNEQLITAVALNDLVSYPADHIDDIIKDFDFYVAMCSYLAAAGCSYNASKISTDFIAPPFNKNRLALILERYLYGKIPEAKIISDYLSSVKKRLEAIGCAKDKHIDLVYSAALSGKILANSGKLDSICEIVRREYENLGEGLNLAICTDFIKDEFYSVENEEDIDEIGVISIFRRLRAKCPDINVAVLTGSRIIIPTALGDELRRIANTEYGITEDEMSIRELGIDFDYSSVDIIESRHRYAVNILTKLFHTKGIQVLIGTIALIGEGWDAPFINSLIIASSVSTYVTSNQVRGRAIRIDRAVPDKVSNIWHLVTMENSGNEYLPGKDYLAISERFIGYEGINSERDEIETGIDRLNVRNAPYTATEVEAANARTFERAANRPATTSGWARSLVDYVPEYYERISDKTVFASYSARIGFMRRRHVKKFTAGLVNALKRADRLSAGTDFRVDYNARTGYKVVLTNANTHEQVLFAEAVKQQYEIGAGTRYVIQSGGKLYPVPDILGRRKDLAEKYKQSLRIPFSKLVFIKNETGKKLILDHMLNNLR